MYAEGAMDMHGWVLVTWMTGMVVMLLAIGLSPVVLNIEVDTARAQSRVRAHATGLYGLLHWEHTQRGAHSPATGHIRGDLMSVRKGLAYLFGPRSLVEMRQLSLRVDLGLDDAAATSWACGAAWTMLSALLAASGAWVRGPSSPPRLAIVPCFDHPALRAELCCILCSRLGHVMAAAAVGLWALWRTRRADIREG